MKEAHSSKTLLHCLLPLLAAALVSVVLYGLVYEVLVKKPVTVGLIGQYFERKLAYMEAIDRSKLVILAGSGGRYSHRCQTLADELGIPCVNGSINAHVGIDLLFLKFRQALNAGDTVYIPLEYELYLWDKNTVDTRQSTAYLAQFDFSTLIKLGPLRVVKGFFYFDLPYLFSGVAEMALSRAGLRRKAGTDRLFGISTMNEWGDEAGHTAAQGIEFQPAVNSTKWDIPTPETFKPESTYSTQVLVDFITWCNSHGIKVIGGIPVAINDHPLPEVVVNRLRNIFISRGARFIVLPNKSQYPRSCFYDTIHHLNEECQIKHSQQLAILLRPLLEH